MSEPDPRILHPERMSPATIDGLNIAWQLRDTAVALADERDSLRSRLALAEEVVEAGRKVLLARWPKEGHLQHALGRLTDAVAAFDAAKEG